MIMRVKNRQAKNYSPATVSDSAAQLKAFKNELARADTMDAFKARIQHIVQTLGFTHFLFMRPGRSWQTGAEQGLLYTLPDELMHIYIECALHRDDLLIQYSKTNTQAIFSSQIYGYINQAPFDTPLIKSNRELLQLYQRFDFFDHCIIPVAASNGYGNVQLLLTTSGLREDKFRSLATPVMSLSRVLCQAIDWVSTKKFRSTFVEASDNPVKITSRQREILQALANRDSSISDVAEALSVTSVTAHQHVCAARKALGVETNIAAVIKALRMGIIDIYEY